MHTLMIGCYAIQHNGDFSGSVILRNKETGRSSTIAFSVLEELVAEKLRADRIARLEQATTEELLS